MPFKNDCSVLKLRFALYVLRLYEVGLEVTNSDALF